MSGLTETLHWCSASIETMSQTSIKNECVECEEFPASSNASLACSERGQADPLIEQFG